MNYSEYDRAMQHDDIIDDCIDDDGVAAADLLRELRELEAMFDDEGAN